MKENPLQLCNKASGENTMYKVTPEYIAHRLRTETHHIERLEHHESMFIRYHFKESYICGYRTKAGKEVYFEFRED